MPMTEEPLILAVDGGATKTRAALSTKAGTVLGEQVGGPCNLFQDPAGGLAEIRVLWQRLATGAGLDADVAAARTTLSAGLAGANAAGSKERFAAAFVAFATNHLSTDGYTSLLGATGGRPGALLAIGTGVVGYRLHASGDLAKLSGWGFPVGDRGGGAWLGLAAVGDWLEARDRYPDAPDSTLWPRLQALLGDSTADILDWLKAARPAEFASLAPIVIDAASTGDAKAQALLAIAAGHHVRLALALAPSPAEPLVLGGGLAGVFRGAIETALGPALADAGHTASPLDGARLIALGQSPAEFI
jgi:glucosamine kinase